MTKTGHLREETQVVFASDVLKQVKLRRLAALACGTILAGSMLSLTLPAYAQAVKKKTVAAEAQAEQPAADAGTIRLDQIVVTATGFEQNVKDAPASITVVPREELEKGSFRSLTDALANVQGVAVTGGANSQDIMIRGLPGAYTLILVDGKRQSTRDARTNSNISGYEQSYMPPASAIERIEVVRGPMSSLYGSDAMGGVINIITRKVDDAWHGEVTVDGTVQNKSRYGNSGQASFYVSGPLVPEVAGLQVWGRGMKRNEDKVLNGTQEQRDGDISGKLTLTPNEDHDIFLEGGITRVRREANPDYTLAENGAYNYNHNDRKHWSVTHVGRWGPTTSEFTFQQEWAKRTSWNWDNKQQAIIENTRIPEIRNSVLDGKFTTPFEFYGDHTLVTGGQYFDAHLKDQNPGRRNNLDETFNIRQWALFMEDEWWVTQDFALTGGLRMDDHEVYGSHFSPRAYAVWHANEQVTFKGGISTGFKAPEIRTIAPGYAYTTGGGGCSYTGKTCGVIIGDDSLKAEKSTSYELAALWDNQNGLQLGGTYFYTDFKDKISNRQILDSNGNPVYWDQDPNYRLWKNFNIDNAVMQGVELTANWEATDDIRLRASYTYTHSRQKGGDFDGLPLTRTPEHMGNIRADWMTPVEGLSAWTAANYHGSETNAGARIGTNGKPVYKDGKVIARKYDAYMTFDIGTSYEFSENVSFNAALYNLFDKRIEESDFNTSVDGRRLWVSMTSKF